MRSSSTAAWVMLGVATTTASHSPDAAVAVPIFWEGELLGFSAVTAHLLDIGGSFPGVNADAYVELPAAIAAPVNAS